MRGPTRRGSSGRPGPGIASGSREAAVRVSPGRNVAATSGSPAQGRRQSGTPLHRTAIELQTQRERGHGDSDTATRTRRLRHGDSLAWASMDRSRRCSAAPTSRTRATCAPRARARTGGGGGRGGAGAGAGGRRAVCRVTGTSTTQRVLSRARARSRELVCRVAGGTCGAVDKVYRVAVGARRGAGAKAVGVGGQAAFVGSPGRGPSEQACRRKSVWCVVGGVRNRRQLLIYGVS